MTRKRLSDNEMDTIITRALVRLPSGAPSRAFTERVMNRVQLPPARPLVLLRHARSWFAQPRRALVFAGAYSVLAIIALVVAGPWLLAQSPSAVAAMDWLAARSGAALRDGTMAVAGWAVSSGLTGFFGDIPSSGPKLWFGVGLLTAGYAGGAVGLHALLRVPRGKDAPANLQA